MIRRILFTVALVALFIGEASALPIKFPHFDLEATGLEVV